MFIRESGSGPSVLLLHGVPSSPADFAPLVERLERSRRVIVPEMPGYLRSSLDDATYSIRRSVEILDEALAARGVTEVSVVGFSAGALRAFGLALDGRVRVSRLVSLSGFAGLDEEGRQGMRYFSGLVRAMAEQWSPDMLAMFVARMLSPAHAAAHPEHAREVLGWLECISPQCLAVELAALGDSEDLCPRLGELRVPILLRAGSLDVAVPISSSHRAAERAPEAELEIVEGKGHALLLEDRDATVESVARFLGA